jgi:hypothetical protein
MLKKFELGRFDATVEYCDSGYVDVVSDEYDISVDSTYDDKTNIFINALILQIMKYDESGDARLLFSDGDREEPSKDFYVIVAKVGDSESDFEMVMVSEGSELPVLKEAISELGSGLILSISRVSVEIDGF